MPDYGCWPSSRWLRLATMSNCGQPPLAQNPNSYGAYINPSPESAGALQTSTCWQGQAY